MKFAIAITWQLNNGSQISTTQRLYIVDAINREEALGKATIEGFGDPFLNGYGIFLYSIKQIENDSV